MICDLCNRSIDDTEPFAQVLIEPSVDAKWGDRVGGSYCIECVESSGQDVLNELLSQMPGRGGADVTKAASPPTAPGRAPSD